MLLNKNIEEQMNRDGVATIPFLLPEELTAVQSFFTQLKKEYTLQFTHGMHMTLWHSDLAFKQKVKGALLVLLQPAFERNFTNCRRLNNIFMVKQAHTEGEFAMHNDWSVVDESRFQSINVWIALQDTTPHNGGLWMLKGSHRIDMPIRGGGALLPRFEAAAKQLKPYCEAVNAQAGEAVLFYHKTIHGSFPNQSDEDRAVCTFSIIPQEAALQICFQKDEHSPMEIYEPADDFNYKYNNLLEDTNTFAPGKHPMKVYPPYHQKEFSAEEVIELITKN
jgi:hypothetical protein